LITLLAFLLMSVYVYRLGKREFGPLIGLSAGLASAIMPLYHSFGRYLFSEPLMIAMSVVAIFHFAEWIDHGRRRDWILSWLGLTLAIALKLEPCIYSYRCSG
jgi:4-amino-4-deoxy-L-arabinose transferase-like glycosyltransferase